MGEMSGYRSGIEISKMILEYLFIPENKDTVDGGMSKGLKSQLEGVPNGQSQKNLINK